MTQPSILAAADYADALITARRAKTTVFLLVMLLLVVELALFFVARYTAVLHLSTDAKSSPMRDLVQYLIGLIDFLGLVLPALLAVILYVILNIQLVARLLGAGRVASAFFWCVLVVFLLFPWQSFLNNPVLNNDAAGMRIPGVLYTWAELTHERLGASFDPKADLRIGILRWARFVGFPIVALILLVIVQLRSDRGLRQALGGASAATDTNTLDSTPT
jgi:hypothetical protein